MVNSGAGSYDGPSFITLANPHPRVATSSMIAFVTRSFAIDLMASSS